MAVPPLPLGGKRTPATQLKPNKLNAKPTRPIVAANAKPKPAPVPAAPIAIFKPDTDVEGAPGRATLPPLAPVVPYEGGLSPAAQKICGTLIAQPVGTIAHTTVDGVPSVFQVGYRVKGGHDPRLEASWVKSVLAYRLDGAAPAGWPNLPPPHYETDAAIAEELGKPATPLQGSPAAHRSFVARGLERSSASSASSASTSSTSDAGRTSTGDASTTPDANLGAIPSKS